MSDYIKDMFIEVREKDETISPLVELEQMIESVREVLGGAVVIEEEKKSKSGERFSMSIPIPKLTPSESWGDPDSQSRQDIERIFASITRKPSIKARIEHVNSFVDPQQAAQKGRGGRFNAILNMMMIIEALQACLNDYSESSAGFIFEGFMAAVTGGKQIAGRVGGTLPIEDFVSGDGEPVSLKLLSPTTPIHGSFTNLVDYLFIRGGSGVPSIKYLIGRKNSDGDDVSQLLLLDFVISRENFVQIMKATGNGAMIEGSNPRGRADGQAFQALASNWQGTPEQIIQMRKILMTMPGYDSNRGMFAKNVDRKSGEFDPAGSEPADPQIKRDQYKKEKDRAQYGISAEKQGYADGQRGMTASFARWMSRQKDLKDADKRTVTALTKLYKKGYDDGRFAADVARNAAQDTQEISESYFGEFHEREKMLMREALNEGKGDSRQWSISAAGTQKIANIADVQVYGEINMSNENIKACADIYIEKMRGDVLDLLETMESFTENVGTYFSAKKRSEAMKANKTAQNEGKQVVELLVKSAEPAKDPLS